MDYIVANDIKINYDKIFNNELYSIYSLNKRVINHKEFIKKMLKEDPKQISKLYEMGDTIEEFIFQRTKEKRNIK